MKNLLYIAALFVCMSCSKTIPNPIPDVFPKVDKTIIVYMVADNNLNSNAFNDIQEMEYGMASVDKNTNLVVYVDKDVDTQVGSTPKIIKIKADTDIKKFASTVVAEYPEQNSTDPAVVTQMLKEVIRKFPADDYDLVLWSHATGWIEASVVANQAKGSRAFGSDNNCEINNATLSAALPIKFNTLWFDCCLMGNVETLYEFRNNATRIVASPNEILKAGAPYEKIIPLMAEGDYNAAAQAYFDHYANRQMDLITKENVSPYATIAVYDPSKLNDLATTIAEQAARCGGYPMNPSTYNIQTMAYSRYYLDKFFDLSDAMEKVFDAQAAEQVNKALDELILYKNATPTFDYVDMDTYCGITTYVPMSGDIYYHSLPWAQLIGWNR